MELEKVHKIVLVVILSSLFLLQVKTSLTKFFNGQVTQSVSPMPVQPMRFPQLTVCPGSSFKEDNYIRANMTPYRVVTHDIRLWPSKADNVERAWNEIVFNVDELIEDIMIYHDTSYECTMRTSNTCPIAIEPIDTLLNGRCFTLSVTRDVTTQDGVMLVLKHPLLQDKTFGENPIVYLHAEGQVGMMIFHCWDEAPTAVTMRPHSEMDLIVKPIFERKTAGIGTECSDNVDQVSFYSCSRDAIGKQLMDSAFGETICPSGTYHPCTIPQTNYFAIDNNKDNFCTSADNAACHGYMIEGLCMDMKNKQVGNCKPPCQSLIYKVRRQYIPGTQESFPNTSLLWMAFEHDYKELHEEYKLFDFNAIVASVGGSLGLFLGFSFLDCIWQTYTKGCQLMAGNAKSTKDIKDKLGASFNDLGQSFRQRRNAGKSRPQTMIGT